MGALSTAKLVIIGLVVLALVSLTATCAVLSARLDAKAAKIADLGHQLTMAAGDAARWQDKAAGDQAVIDGQAQEIARLAADRAAAARISAEKQARAEQRASALQSQISQLKEQAREHPQDVRDLGPLVRGALPSLRQ
jgi:DNA repair exonuclease SbcCD ATPase subunit